MQKLRPGEFKGPLTGRTGKGYRNSRHYGLNIELFPRHHAVSQRSVKACEAKVCLAPTRRREFLTPLSHGNFFTHADSSLEFRQQSVVLEQFTRLPANLVS